MSRRHSLIGASKPWLYKEEDAEFYYRQTSGGVLMNNSPLVGSIDRIKGQTIAWNQLVENGNFVNTNGWTSTATRSASNNVLYVSGQGNNQIIHQQSYIVGHKYIGFASVKTSESVLIYYRFVNTLVNVLVGTSWQRISQMLSVTSGNENKPITMYVYTEGTSYEVRDVVLFDLTLIYGAGNEPSTPEQFEADYFKWFGKPLTYEPYDAGSLRSVKMSGIKSVGFNLWDEEWELGGYVANKGTEYSWTNRIRSKNFIPVLNNEPYYVKGALFFFQYDENKNFIPPYINVNNSIVQLYSSCRYIRFSTNGNPSQTTYNNDICINISDTNKNGTYESHWSEIRNIPITNLTGKVNGQGESVVVFPDGMKGVNDVKDEIYIEDGVTKAIKRVGRVDLWSLTWAYDSLNVRFQSNIISAAKVSSNNTICFRYLSTRSKTDKTIFVGASANVFVYDSSYTDATTFKTAMSGVMLDYELAEPQVYVLDTPLPIAYNCEAGGTEQILPEVIGTGVAPIMDIKYKAGNVAEKPWYGIKWSEDNGQMQRIASNMELHATLPIQSNMKRCMLLDNGSVYKYISDADPFLYEDGTSVKYDGTDGQVMVEVPAYWYTAYKETDENNITWNYLKLYPEGGGQRYSRKIYRGAFEMITDNSYNNVAKGCSVSMLDFTSMGTTKDTTSFVASNMEYLSAATSYRNWNYANVDATDVKNSLGKPTTNRNRATFRGIAARRGAGFSQEYWDSYNSLIRLYVVEYCNFNIQANINNSLTVEGFKQGGLGAGVTNVNSTKWNNFNSYNPFVPCGVTVPLGNKSGAVNYAFTNDDFDDVSITYSVPSYRGIENPFGHIWKFIDGLNRKGKVENDVTTEMIYVCDTVSKFAENDADGYVLQSDTAPRASGYFGGVDWDAKGTFWPKLGVRTMYSGYFYNAYANNIWYTLAGGGAATSGSHAGLFCLLARDGSGSNNATIGSRLLYTK